MKLQAKYSNLKHWKSELTGVFLPRNPEKQPIYQELVEIFGDLPNRLIKSHEFSTDEDAFLLLHGNARTNSDRIALIGAGADSPLDYDVLRRGAARLAKAAIKARLKQIAFVFPSYLIAESTSEAAVAEAIVEGVLLATYQFEKYRTSEKKKQIFVDEITLITMGNPDDQLEISMKRAATVCSAVSLTRDLANAPGNEMTPKELAKRASEMCRSRKIRCTIFNEVKLKTLKMGGILGVAQGSNEPPRMIIMEYKPVKAINRRPIVLVGKGVTFDAGGISIKPASEMDRMKFDMCGGAAVIGIMQAVADLKLPVSVVGLVPTSENLLGSRAYKPGDILTMYSGKTVEVLNTDAEGRLLLADALAYSQKYKPEAIVDFATLTGHVIVALGHHGAGMFGTDESMKNRLKESAEFTAEKVWELPIWKEFDKQLSSHVADIKNIGGRPAGASTAALFLKHFVGNYPWVHLDIAGTANTEEEAAYTGKVSSTGFGVRLMVDVLRRWKA